MVLNKLYHKVFLKTMQKWLKEIVYEFWQPIRDFQQVLDVRGENWNELLF